MAKVKSLEEEFLAGDMLLDDADGLLPGEEDGDGGEGGDPGDDDSDDLDDDDVLDNEDTKNDGDDDDDDDEDDDEDEDDDDDEEEKEESDAKSKSPTPTGKEKPAADGKGEIEEGDDNEHYLRAQYWQEQGTIPKDVKLDPKMTQLEFEDLYAKSIHNNVINEYRGTFKARLEAKGINPDEIFLGPQNQDVFLRDTYRTFTNVTYEDLVEGADESDEEDTSITDTVKNLGKEFYRSGNPKLDAEAIDTLVQKDFDKNTEEANFEKYQKHFIAEVKRLDKKIVDDEKAAKLRETQKAESDAAEIKQAMESGEIGGRKHTPEEIKKVTEAMYVKNQVYVAPDGSRERVTLFEKLRREAGDDVKKQLALVSHLVLGRNEQEIKQTSELRGSRKLLDKLAQVGSKGGNSTKAQSKKSKSKGVLADEFFLD